MIIRLYATIVLFFLACCGAFAAEPATPGLAGRFVEAAVPAPVPDLLFLDGEGRERKLRAYLRHELKGRHVLLSVWATWCQPCLKELPALDALQRDMGAQNFTVMALAQDHDGLALIPAFFRRHGIRSLAVYADPQSGAIRNLGLRGLPANLFINPQGEEIGRVNGPVDWADPATVSFLKQRIAPR